MSKYILFKDEYQAHMQKRQQLLDKYKEEGERKGFACQQGSETWHDNFDFEDATRMQELLGRQIKEIDVILNSSRIVELSNLANSNGKVSIGKKVSLNIDGVFSEFIIGGFNTLISGRISYNSPVGEAILGKEIGDIIDFTVNNKQKVIEILTITL